MQVWRDQQVQANYWRDHEVSPKRLTDICVCLCMIQLKTKGLKASYWIDGVSKTTHGILHDRVSEHQQLEWDLAWHASVPATRETRKTRQTKSLNQLLAGSTWYTFVSIYINIPQTD